MTFGACIDCGRDDQDYDGLCGDCALDRDYQDALVEAEDRREKAVTNPLDWFTYPRIWKPGNTIVLGYDFGCFVDGQYRVIGNSKTREMAERLIYAGHQPKTLTHEDEPSPSLNGTPRR